MNEDHTQITLARALSNTLGISVQSEEAEQLEQRLKDMCNNAMTHGFVMARNMCFQAVANRPLNDSAEAMCERMDIAEAIQKVGS